jgi:outer membrane usher protein
MVPTGGSVHQNRVGNYAAGWKGAAARPILEWASGGFAALGGTAFLTRRINDSFAVVQVPGIENVRVYADNQEIGRTDSNGDLLLPRLRPYDRNQVSIEQLDLPLDAEIKSLSIDVTPYYRSGVAVGFPIRRVRSAILRLVQEDGSAVPPGAHITLTGSEQTFPIGFDGALYVAGLAQNNELRARWDGKTCALTLTLPANPDPQFDFGIVVCKEVMP